MKMFGLKHKKSGRLATWSASSNDGADFAAPVAFTISDSKYDL